MSAVRYSEYSTESNELLHIEKSDMSLKDKIEALAASRKGRQILSQFIIPSSEIFFNGAKPVMVRDYYVMAD